MILKVRWIEVGEAMFEVQGRQSVLHQALSLGRDSFRMHHPLTFDTMGFEVGGEEHGILNSWWSTVTVFPKNFIRTFFNVK